MFVDHFFRYLNYPTIYVMGEFNHIETSPNKYGIYMCIFEDLDSERAWITNLFRIDFHHNYFWVRHPFISAGIFLTFIITIMSITGTYVYKLELAKSKLDKATNMFIEANKSGQKNKKENVIEEEDNETELENNEELDELGKLMKNFEK